MRSQCTCCHTLTSPADARMTTAARVLCSDKHGGGERLYALGIRILVLHLVFDMRRFIKNQSLRLFMAFPVRPCDNFSNVLFDALTADDVVVARVYKLHGDIRLHVVHWLNIGLAEAF